MKFSKQILLSIGMVAVALAIVSSYALLGGADEPQVTTAGSEDHAAMAMGGGEARPVRLDAEGARRIGVTYASAQVRTTSREVSTVGNVTYDETRLANVNPRVEGWVEELHVDFTGAPVRRGQPLLSVYSPMLVSAQEELLLALRLAEESAAGGGERASSNARDLLDSARRRLRQWDIPQEEIDRIESSGTPLRVVVLRSPATGVVVEKNVVAGDRIMPGMSIYKIADLSRVWVEGEVFEKDLSLVRPGLAVSLSFEAYPGDTFTGTVTYVYPTVSFESRTARMRVELANPDLRLKPGMYARLLLTSAARTALLIPRSAVHFTGARAMVFVRAADGTLDPREITTGLVTGDHIEVVAGLVENEQVVASANFLIDAEANMGSGVASMPGMEKPAGHTGH